MPAANLPYVTAENAAMFVFDLKNDTPAIRDNAGRTAERVPVLSIQVPEVGKSLPSLSGTGSQATAMTVDLAEIRHICHGAPRLCA